MLLKYRRKYYFAWACRKLGNICEAFREARIDIYGSEAYDDGRRAASHGNINYQQRRLKYSDIWNEIIRRIEICHIKANAAKADEPNVLIIEMADMSGNIWEEISHGRRWALRPCNYIQGMI